MDFIWSSANYDKVKTQLFLVMEAFKMAQWHCYFESITVCSYDYSLLLCNIPDLCVYHSDLICINYRSPY